jgi:hypothetical protein
VWNLREVEGFYHRRNDAASTTTTTNPGPAPGVFVGVPGVAGVQVGGPPAPGPGGCTTSNSTTTNDQTGATRSTTGTNC